MAKNRNQDEESSEEMTLEEASAYRASLAPKHADDRSEEQKKDDFRRFWAQEKSKYGMPKELEEALWLHLKAINKDNPKDFEAGLSHFGLTKI